MKTYAKPFSQGKNKGFIRVTIDDSYTVYAEVNKEMKYLEDQITTKKELLTTIKTVEEQLILAFNKQPLTALEKTLIDRGYINE